MSRLEGYLGLLPRHPAVLALSRLVAVAHPRTAQLDGLLRRLGFGNHRGLGESGEVELIRRIVAAGGSGLAVDVGANSGQYASALAAAGFREVVMVEPHPAHLEPLARIAADHQGFIHHPVAVSDTRGSALLHFSSRELAHASLAEEVDAIAYVRNEEQVAVRTVTLDELWGSLGRRRIDLLKIDVEGFEHEVLIGGASLMSESPPTFIQIEMNLHQLVRGHSLFGLSRLMPAGYDGYQLLPWDRGVRRIDVLDPYSNIYRYSNFVFCAPDAADALSPRTVRRSRQRARPRPR